MGCVYQARNTVNGLIYIGYTQKSMEVRRRQHESAATLGPRCPLHRAMAEFGLAKFRWRVLYNSDDLLTLIKKETQFIRENRTNEVAFGYNVPTYTKKCEYVECGKTFTTEKETAKYCSPVCKNKAMYWRRCAAIPTEERVKTKVCPVCGAVFTTTLSYRVYCPDKDCAAKAKEARNKARRTG